MFSSIALCSTILCIRPGNVDRSTVAELALVCDIIMGLALLIIGCLSMSGIIPCSTTGGGFMIVVGCLELIGAPFVTIGNCCLISVWDSFWNSF